VTINEDDEGLPFEAFTQMGKAGGCAASQLEAIARLVSLCLRCGVEVKSIVEQLRGIRCPSPSWARGGGRIFSCADAIARVMEKRLVTEADQTKRYIERQKIDAAPKIEGKTVAVKSTKVGNVVGVCPDCGGALRHQEGCVVCRACGYSKCG
jgi:ribonucleoside-diphosphate reductase alpha chain